MEKAEIINKEMLHYAVVLPRPLLPLTYASTEALPLGTRVCVPLRREQVIGIVWAVAEKPDFPVKSILQRLDDEALFDIKMLNLFYFCARYYGHPLGSALETAIPNWLRQGKALPTYKTFPSVPEERIELSAAQNQVLEALPRTAQVTLLEGVTGSGKSEIYAAYARELLENGGQALFLTPEMGLAPALLQTLQRRTGLRGTLYHSALSPKKRAQIWTAARAGDLDFVVGTRSAIFLPFRDLRGIVVDEEHDLSYKQQEALRYHARDVAVWRARQLNIPLILGTATPSLESFHQVQLGHWQHVRLQQRAKTEAKPRIVLDDGRSGRIGVLSMRLITAIRHTLQDGGQALLFLNRRGFATVLQCPHCDYRNQCPHCDRLMTIHLRRGLMHCHHCQQKEALPARCPQCGSSDLEVYGLGTERLEKTVQQQFPQARILRIDSDEYSTAKRFQEAIDKVKNGEVDLVLGTQWLAKGHHFPKMRLVAVVDADQALHSMDYRCEERLAQLLLQVGGRAGREGEGTIWIQTRQASQPVFQVFQQDYGQQLQRLYAERREALLPPHSAQALFIAEHREQESAFQVLMAVQESIQHPDCFWLGPAPAFLARRAGQYRAHLLLQAPQKKIIQALLPSAQEALQRAAQEHRAFVAIDVDPLLLD